MIPSFSCCIKYRLIVEYRKEFVNDSICKRYLFYQILHIGVAVKPKHTVGENRAENKDHVRQQVTPFVSKVPGTGQQIYKKPFDLLMSYYECAIMEVETKFRVLKDVYKRQFLCCPYAGFGADLQGVNLPVPVLGDKLPERIVYLIFLFRA